MRFPMTFSSTSASTPQCGSRCPSVVVAEGVIEPETPEAFDEFALREALSPDRPSLIYLNSPGGNVVASMELGDEFRRLRVTAIVAGMAAGGAALPDNAPRLASTRLWARRDALPIRRVASGFIACRWG